MSYFNTRNYSSAHCFVIFWNLKSNFGVTFTSSRQQLFTVGILINLTVLAPWWSQVRRGNGTLHDSFLIWCWWLIPSRKTNISDASHFLESSSYFCSVVVSLTARVGPAVFYLQVHQIFSVRVGTKSSAQNPYERRLKKCNSVVCQTCLRKGF
jgi:hypothetical protein